MSFQVVARVLADSEARLSQRLILIVVAETAHDDGISFIGQAEIAHKARLTRTHVADEVKVMEARGLIQIRKAQRGRRRISVYRINLPGLPKIDYDRLPFVVDNPFLDVVDNQADDVGDSDTAGVDGVGSRGLTVSEVGGFSSATPLVDLEPPLEPPLDLLAREAREVPPMLEKIGGQDIAFNALAEVCGVDPKGNRAREVGIALNGSKQSGLPLGIRTLAWPKAQEAGETEGLRFEQFLVAAIFDHARQYRERMGDAMLTPLALAKWWTDIELTPAKAPTKFGRRDVSSRELLDLADRLDAEQTDERRALESG